MAKDDGPFIVKSLLAVAAVRLFISARKEKKLQEEIEEEAKAREILYGHGSEDTQPSTPAPTTPKPAPEETGYKCQRGYYNDYCIEISDALDLFSIFPAWARYTLRIKNRSGERMKIQYGDYRSAPTVAKTNAEADADFGDRDEALAWAYDLIDGWPRN
jgi:hypothetical protein